MPFEIHPATPSDATALTEIFFSAFSSDFDRQLFPETPLTREWWIKKFTSICSKPSDVFLKAVDPSKKAENGDNVIAGYAIWRVPGDVEAGSSGSKEDGPPLPEGSDKELCEMFFEWMNKQRDACMGERRHYCMYLAYSPCVLHYLGLISNPLQS